MTGRSDYVCYILDKAECGLVTITHIPPGGNAPNVNHAVTVPIRTQQECVDSYPQEDITDNMFCAGSPNGGIDSCQVG